jgi:hypothetical protein
LVGLAGATKIVGSVFAAWLFTRQKVQHVGRDARWCTTCRMRPEAFSVLNGGESPCFLLQHSKVLCVRRRRMAPGQVDHNA